MYPENFRQLLSDLIHSDTAQRESAFAALRSLDEEIVDPLVGEFYSGVSEALGIAILELVAEIGGPDALSLVDRSMKRVVEPGAFELMVGTSSTAAVNGRLEVVGK